MHWLLKTEPTDYSFDDLLRDKRTTWSGVTNPAALKHLREMKPGDGLLIYHTGSVKAVVGTGTVAKAAFPDPKQEDARLVVVDIKAGKKLAHPVTLAQIKSDKRFEAWALVKIGRLSVVPTTPEQYKAILALASQPDSA